MESAAARRSYRLSPTQHGMLYHHLRGDGEGVDVEQIVGRLPEEVDIDTFRESWLRLAERHDALRTAFSWEGRDEPVQVVHPEPEVSFEFEDWSEASAGEREDRLDRVLERDRRAGFDLSEPPLFRVRLFRFGKRDHVLVWTFHHAIVDGRSFPVALRELFRIRDALCRGEEPELADPPAYEDHVRWLEEDYASDVDEEYWRDALAGFPAPTPLPYDDSAEVDTGDEGGGSRGEARRRLSTDLTDRLRELAESLDVRLNTIVQAAWGLLLARFADRRDVVFGAARAGRGASFEGADRAVGMFMNTVPVRVSVDPDTTVAELLEELRARSLAVREHEHAPLADVQRWSDVPPGEPLFHSLLVYDHASLDAELTELGGDWEEREFRLLENPGYPLALYAYGESELLLQIRHDRNRIGDARADRLLDYLSVLLEGMADDPSRTAMDVPFLPADERRRLLETWNDTGASLPDARPEELFERQAAETPDHTAVVWRGREVTYRELDRRADRIAERLRRRGVGPGTVVGICRSRTPALVASLLAVHKAGGAYLPLDPTYPEERLRHMLDNSGAALVLTEEAHEDLVPEGVDRLTDLDGTPPAGEGGADPGQGDDATGGSDGGAGDEPSTPGDAAPSRDDLAYVIYTSGSTGQPKGVMIEHGNVVNFFRGMEDRIGGPPRTLLAVTSLSFDISVLELYWTLTRGDRVVLLPGDPLDALPGSREADPNRRSSTAESSGGSVAPTPAEASEAPSASPSGAMDFGLFFFGGDASLGDERYGLLLEAAEFADRRGFSSVWTPERHFHEFGGPYPNPSVAGAAVAAVTDRLDIRAGSVVLPLHDPIRVAEEWAVVDGISGGRTGIAFASGWQPEDFVLAPERHEGSKEWMFREIQTVRRLWRGQEIRRMGPDGDAVDLRTHPTPVQDELPIWVTAAGSPETFRRAGMIGAGVLTHMLGQSVETLAEKIETYRRARQEAGHPGPGHVTVMLHAFLGADDDQVREAVREPLKSYLASSVSLVKKYADQWTAYRGSGGEAESGAEGDEFANLSEEDREALLDHAFQRYYETSGLLGTPEKCDRLVSELDAIGVDEVAALVDFGLAGQRVLDGLEHLDTLRQQWAEDGTGGEIRDEEVAGSLRGEDEGGGEAVQATNAEPARPASLPELIRRHDVTDLQCTPSLLRLLMADRETRDALSGLERLLVGGESFPPDLAADAMEGVSGGEVHNMYGPTETTIWSATHRVEEPGDRVPIGRPIANTRCYVLDSRRRLVPTGVAGELYIGGAGVGRGYLDRPDLTAGVFLDDPFLEGDERMYRTGDRVRHRKGEDGVLEFIDRTDRQVKIRGHRVELGEVEAVLRGHPAVETAVVRLLDGESPALAAYVTPDAGNGDRETERPDIDGLDSFARERLPEFMAPDVVTVLDELPLTPNGKIDRDALPDVRGAEQQGDGAGEPGDVEARLAGIWETLLEVDAVDRGDDFFDLGGNSLAVIQLSMRIRDAFGTEVKLGEIFEASSLGEMAELISSADGPGHP